MDYKKFYKTTTKSELFHMVQELAALADKQGDENIMIEAMRQKIKGKIDWEEFYDMVGYKYL